MGHVVSRSSPVTVVALALAALITFASTISQAEEPQGERGERHPHIHASLRELREAKAELETAAHDFGGHRADAVKAVEHAIRQLAQALKFDPAGVQANRATKQPDKAVEPDPATAQAKHAEGQQGEHGERHPHIHAALKELQEAKVELETAAHDFGGHRAEAVKAVEQAIRQLHKALESDAK
jgi:tetratricopeptide (TPR) repeat protein